MKINCISGTSGYYRTLKNQKKKNISFNGILEVSDKYKGREEFLAKNIKQFIPQKENYGDYIGQGLTAKAYRLKVDPLIVIKESMNFLKGSENFEREADELNFANKCFPNEYLQKFICRYQNENYPYNYFLLTEFMDGKSVDRNTRLDESAMNQFFDLLAKLDSKKIYHGDINLGNTFYDKTTNKVGLMDFQWASHEGNKKETCTPDFINVQNVQMLEMAFVGSYLDNLSDEEKMPFLKMYLQQKSTYYKKRYETFGSDFDKHMATVLENPTDDIIKLEALKIQFLQSFRDAYQYADPNMPDNIKNVRNAPLAFLQVYNDSMNFYKAVSDEANKPDNSVEKHEYLKDMAKYGKYWKDNFREWSDGMLELIKQANSKYYRYSYTPNDIQEQMKTINDTKNILKGLGMQRSMQNYEKLRKALASENGPYNSYTTLAYWEIKTPINVIESYTKSIPDKPISSADLRANAEIEAMLRRARQERIKDIAAAIASSLLALLL